jgi:hypothetical protein
MSILAYIAATAWREATMLAKTLWMVFIVIPAAIPLVATRLDWPWLRSLAALLPWWGWLWTAVIVGIAGLLGATAKRAKRLESEATPNLDIEFHNDSRCIVKGSMPGIGKNGRRTNIRGTLIRVIVHNTSPRKSMRARCIVPKIDDFEHAFCNQELQPLQAAPIFPLAPDGTQIVGVLFVPDDINCGHIFINYDNSLKTIGRALPRQNYRIKIQADGIDSASISRWLVLNLDSGINAYLEN